MADPVGVSIAFGDTWDDTTPTWVRIDTLNGVNVSEWKIDRGRPNEFAKTGTGTATVRGFDTVGIFDPTNATGTYFGDLVPHKQAAIALYDPVLAAWHTVFRGFVEGWKYRLAPTRNHFEFEIQLVDGFALLAAMELQPGEAGVVPLPDGVEAGNVFYEDTEGSVRDRLEAVLNDVGWPAALSDLFTGNVRVREKVYGAGTSALAALQEAADAEFPGVANLYMSKEGVLTFHGRQPRFRPDVAEYGINERDVGDDSATDLDDTVVPLSAFEFDMDDANICNQCLAYPEGALPTEIDGQLFMDSAAITAYGMQSLTFDNLQTLDGLATSNTALEETLLFATYYVENYKAPYPRISRMTFRPRMPDHRLASAVWLMLCRAEISDKLNVFTTHPGGGGFTDEAFFVEGLHYVCRPGNDEIPDVTLDVDVSPAARWTTNPFDADEDPPGP